MQMMMLKILQFLGKVARYKSDGKTIITDKEWTDQMEAWRKATEEAGKANLHPDKVFEGWHWYDPDSKINYGQAPDWVVKIVAPIIEVLNSLLVPIIVLLGTAGMIYAIVLGVQYSKAETADKRDEAKKRLIHAIIGIVIMLVVLILMKIFLANAFSIFGWVNTTAESN